MRGDSTLDRNQLCKLAVRGGLCTPRRTSILVDLWTRVHQKWTSKCTGLSWIRVGPTWSPSESVGVRGGLGGSASVPPRWSPRRSPPWSNWSHVSPRRNHVEPRRTQVHQLERQYFPGFKGSNCWRILKKNYHRS